MNGATQWLRYCKLTIASESTKGGSQTQIEALDLSQFRIKFTVDQATVSKPTTAEITVYNISPDTIKKIPAPTNRAVANQSIIVILEAGYQENHAVIFKGYLWWKTVGRESATETYLKLVCSSGSMASHYAVVNASIPKGATQNDIFKIVAQSMNDNGVQTPETPILMATQLPRGKVVYKMTKDAMQGLADTNSFDWYVGSDGFKAVPKGESYDPKEVAIILNSDTGMLGRPTMTTVGVNVSCLLNPRINVGSIVQIDNAKIIKQTYSTEVDSVAQNFASTDFYSDADGLYKVIARTHQGDNRGNEWATTLICQAVSGNPIVNPSVLNFTGNTA